jgi:hypothetical protein
MKPRPVALTLYAYSLLFAGTAVVLYYLRGTAWVPIAAPVTLALVLAFLFRLGYHRTFWESRGIRRLRGRPALAEEPSPAGSIPRSP